MLILHLLQATARWRGRSASLQPLSANHRDKTKSQQHSARAAASDFEVSRKVKWAALNKFEVAGLIKVDRRRGKSPLVTLLHL
jgi:hypothetical protein